MNDTKTLTDLVASEIVSKQHETNGNLDTVVDEMNLPYLAIRICQFHELQVKREDISVVCIGAVVLAQIQLFPDMHYLDGVTQRFNVLDVAEYDRLCRAAHFHAALTAKQRQYYTEMERKHFGIA